MVGRTRPHSLVYIVSGFAEKDIAASARRGLDLLGECGWSTTVYVEGLDGAHTISVVESNASVSARATAPTAATFSVRVGVETPIEFEGTFETLFSQLTQIFFAPSMPVPLPPVDCFQGSLVGLALGDRCSPPSPTNHALFSAAFSCAILPTFPL